MEPAIVDTHERKKALQHFESAPGVEVSVRIVAISGVAPGDKDAVGAAHECLGHKHGIDTTGTGDPNDAQVGGLLETGNAGCICTAIRAPIAEKANNSKLFLTYI
jgi:hypothetical protein